LNFDQIENLPPNPAKVTDSRYEGYRALYGDESFELDALEPRVIVALIQDNIDDLIDTDLWEAAVARQQLGRDQLEKVSKRWDDVTEFLNG
jgi:hypothetical protein